MEVLRKELFIACDGREFENQQDCMDWEQSLVIPKPIHLKDEQVVELFTAAYIVAFKEIPESYDTKIKLYIRRRLEDKDGFAFRFTYHEGQRIYNFTGELAADSHNGLYFHQTLQVGEDKYERSPDWDSFDILHFQAAYQYLDKIGFFRPQPNLKENPHLKKNNWRLIYAKTYTQMKVLN